MSGKKNLHEGNILYFTLKVCKKTGTKKKKKRLWWFSSKGHFKDLTRQFSPKPKDGKVSKYCHMPLNHRCRVVLGCLSSERQFAAVTIKYFLNTITTQKIDNLQNSVSYLKIFFSTLSFGANHQNDI